MNRMRFPRSVAATSSTSVWGFAMVAGHSYPTSAPLASTVVRSDLCARPWPRCQFARLPSQEEGEVGRSEGVGNFVLQEFADLLFRRAEPSAALAKGTTECGAECLLLAFGACALAVVL